MPPAAQAAAVNINAPADWPAGGAISLNDGDVLTIAAAAGSPAISTVIQLAANASVTINGSGAMVTNLHIQDGADTAAHNVSINNLHITAGGSNDGYNHLMGVLVLTGDNELVGAGAGHGINANGTLTITSASGGKLTVDATGMAYGINAVTTLNIEGSADVTALAAFSLHLTGASNAINVAAGAKLTATAGAGFDILLVNSSLAITCDGTFSTAHGIYVIGQSVSITGTGTVSATGDGGEGILAASLTVDRATVNVSSTWASNGLDILGAANVALTHGATLNVTGGPNVAAFSGPGFTLDAGSSVTLANNSAVVEQHPFTMSAAGTWQLSGSAAFVAPATATSSPATISVAAGTSGTIRLAPAPVSGAAAAVPTLGEWSLLLLALAMLGMAGAGLKRRV